MYSVYLLEDIMKYLTFSPGRLLKEMKKKDGGNKIVVSMLVSKCVRELNEKQRKNVPEPASELVHKKWLKVQEKKKL